MSSSSVTRVTKQSYSGTVLDGLQNRYKGLTMELKTGAIYRLPNGRELVALLSRNKRPVLYTLSASHQCRYELNQDGRLLRNAELTAWGIEDLLETGRTAPPDLATSTLEHPSIDGAFADGVI